MGLEVSFAECFNRPSLKMFIIFIISLVVGVNCFGSHPGRLLRTHSLNRLSMQNVMTDPKLIATIIQGRNVNLVKSTLFQIN